MYINELPFPEEFSVLHLYIDRMASHDTGITDFTVTVYGPGGELKAHPAPDGCPVYLADGEQRLIPRRSSTSSLRTIPTVRQERSCTSTSSSVSSRY